MPHLTTHSTGAEIRLIFIFDVVSRPVNSGVRRARQLSHETSKKKHLLSVMSQLVGGLTTHSTGAQIRRLSSTPIPLCARLIRALDFRSVVTQVDLICQRRK